MTETGERLWKKPQIVKDYAKSITKKHPPTQEEVDVWTELRGHPAWNNLFTILENYINRCAELETKANSQKHYIRDVTMKKITIRKKYKKYKKRYKLFKTESSRMSDSGCDYPSCSDQRQMDNVHYKRDDVI